MLVSVIGTGYLGATHAACLAADGHEVVGIDTDPDKVETLAAGAAPFHETGLADLLRQGVRSGRLRFTTDVAQARGADVHFLCVGTPEAAEGRRADLTQVQAACAALAPVLDRPCLVVGKSTVPVNTAPALRDLLRARAPAGDEVALAWNPEFLREGRAVADSLRPDRVVAGVERDADAETLRRVYAAVLARGVPFVVTDLATAELAKVSANAMLAARVSLVNLLAEVCEAAGADVADLTAILGADPRIGHDYLAPGLGYGGGCLPKDTRAFVARGRELGVDGPLALLEAVEAINEHQRARTVERALALLGDPSDSVVAVLGGAFKPDSDDVRDSPALAVATRLAEVGVRVRVHDPEAGRNVRRAAPSLEVRDSVEDAVGGADLTLLLTAWEDYAALDAAALAPLVRRPVVLDARGALDVEAWSSAGWDVEALGRRPRSGDRAGGGMAGAA